MNVIVSYLKTLPLIPNHIARVIQRGLSDYKDKHRCNDWAVHSDIYFIVKLGAV